MMTHPDDKWIDELRSPRPIQMTAGRVRSEKVIAHLEANRSSGEKILARWKRDAEALREEKV